MWEESGDMHTFLTLNITNLMARHEALWKVLELLPTSRLGLLARTETHEDIMSLCSDYNLAENEYFFDRCAL